MRESILYVDDEEKALKYFKKIFADEYEILIAENADSAWKIIEERKGEIAVLLSDQRMPGGTGVELLKRTRQKYPKIIRIIITAYADLDNAIESVNEGAVFQYITKPWEQQQLRLTMKQAVDFYTLQNERDMLLQAKLSMVQRLIIGDRVQNLAAFFTGNSHLNNALHGFAAFIAQLPPDVQEYGKGAAPKFWQDIGRIAQKQSRTVLDLLQLIKGQTAGIGKDSTENIAEVKDLLQSVIDGISKKTGNTIAANIDIKNCILKNGAASIRRSFETLINVFIALYGDDVELNINASASPDTDSAKDVQVDISTIGKCLAKAQLSRCYSLLRQDDDIDFSLQILTAFLAIFHYGGTVTFTKDNSNFKIRLPVNENSQVPLSFMPDCMDILTKRFDSWDAAM